MTTELYEAIAPRLTNYLVASGSTYEQACDIVQETFLKIMRLGDAVLPDLEKVSGLAFATAKNLRKDIFRKDGRLEFTEELSDEVFGVARDTERAVERGDVPYLRMRLQKALATLPPLLREAFLLFQVMQLSIREIAIRTGASESLVKVRIFRAREKLRPLLQDLL